MANLKAPIEQSNFNDLREHIRLKIPDNVVFELPEIDENFVFKYLSALDTSKATGLDVNRPKLLKLSSEIITKSITDIIYIRIINETPFLNVVHMLILITTVQYLSY